MPAAEFEAADSKSAASSLGDQQQVRERSGKRIYAYRANRKKSKLQLGSSDSPQAVKPSLD
jgi:hypothetical protein